LPEYHLTKNSALALLTFAAILVFSAATPAQTTQPATAAPSSSSSSDPALTKSTEAFIRKLFGWGPSYQLELGPMKPSPSPDFYTVPIKVTVGGQSDTGTVYVSKDGKTFLRGEMFDTTKDPFADNRAKLKVADSPTLGPADAKFTLYEFSDFECPHCRALHTVLKQWSTEHPDVRIVFKNFPLTQIHPWAETAAIGAHCAYIQNPAAFWTIQDQIFDAQDLISAENVWDKLVSFAASSNLDASSFKSCLTSDSAKAAIASDVALGSSLAITSTPTIYLNARPLIGPDSAQLTQLLSLPNP
jgi:protein-disulfide isomerase